MVSVEGAKKRLSNPWLSKSRLNWGNEYPYLSGDLVWLELNSVALFGECVAIQNCRVLASLGQVSQLLGKAADCGIICSWLAELLKEGHAFSEQDATLVWASDQMIATAMRAGAFFTGAQKEFVSAMTELYLNEYVSCAKTLSLYFGAFCMPCQYSFLECLQHVMQK